MVLMRPEVFYFFYGNGKGKGFKRVCVTRGNRGTVRLFFCAHCVFPFLGGKVGAAMTPSGHQSGAAGWGETTF
jgi:hypothetical protein